jgi:maltose/moltooligosaccharide transporter
MTKPRFNLWQLWNMSFGFLGIQFGWGLQMANTSAIFEYLGADADQIPILWLAAPVTGLLVQPIVGNLSDNTWTKLGRRRPYFLVGAVLSSLALIWMPNVSSLWMAAGALWVLDTSVNISMEPFRAFVGDLLPEDQRTQGFAMQSLLIGLGSVSASALPWLLSHVFGLDNSASTIGIPLTVKWAFYMGAAVFLSTVLWTIVSTPEYPPEDLTAFRQQQQERLGAQQTIGEIITALREMPGVMRQLAVVQCLSWAGMFCFFLYFPPAIARNIFGATDQTSPLYTQGIEWAGLCIAGYNAVCFLVSFLLPRLVEMSSRKTAHALCLLCGALGFVSLYFIHQPVWVLLSMVGVGITWASLLSLPYAMLIGVLPEQKIGIYMGIFNFFIVLPEVFVSLGLGWVVEHSLGSDRLLAVVMGGCFLFLSAIVSQRIQEPAARETRGESLMAPKVEPS